MANPVIDSVTPAGPITAQVGSKVTVNVVAHDDDTHDSTLVIQVKDAAGNLSQPATVALKWVDNMVLVASVDDGKPVTISGMTVSVQG